MALAPLFASVAHAADGAALYQQKCQMCHQPGGVGLAPAFPPVAKSEWVTGPAENLIRIQLRGLTGKISVAGKEYTGVMPANATMTDEEIAAVLTYIRSNFGNKADAVTAEMVKKFRGEVGKPMLTVADLKDPNKKEEKKEEGGAKEEGNAKEGGEAAAPEIKKSELSLDSGSNALIIGLTIGWIALCTVPALFGGKK
eukprot:Seg15785.1 transcript_id=Seg15785.1/GoldUCD/mRNA.D3Y31 product="Cytochrome c-552" protein_id=Seg15785.1/GoldUCD/D3Y31